MKWSTRPIVAIPASAILILLLLAWWNIFVDNSPMRQYIHRQIVTALGEKAEYQNLQIALNRVVIDHIKIPHLIENSKSIALEAETVEIEFDYSDWVQHLFSPEHRVLRLIIANPTLTYTEDTDQTNSPTSNSQIDTASSAQKTANRSVARHEPEKRSQPKLELIQSISISDGRIVLTGSNHPNDSTTYIRKIAGWVRADDESKAKISLSGELAYLMKSRLNVSTTVDLNQLSLNSIKLSLDSLEYKGELPVSFPGHIFVDRGMAEGELTFSRHGHLKNEVEVHGDLHLNNARFLCEFDSTRLEPLSAKERNDDEQASFFSRSILKSISNTLSTAPVIIDSVNFDAVLKNGQLMITRGRQVVNSQPMQIKGSIKFNEIPIFFPSKAGAKNQFLLKIASAKTNGKASQNQHKGDKAPVFDLEFGCDSLVIQDFLEPIFNLAHSNGHSNGIAKQPILGKANVRGSLTGSLHSPQVKARFISARSEVYGKVVKNLSTEITYDGGQSHGSVNVLHWEGSGVLDLSNNRHFQNDAPSAKNSEVGWQGWGKIDLTSKSLPLDITIVSDGYLSHVISNFLTSIGFEGFKREKISTGERSDQSGSSSRFPDIRMTGVTQISGPVLKPVVKGQLNVDLNRGKKDVANWLGYYSFNQDTLELDLAQPNQISKLRAKIWQLGKKPLFKIEGLDQEILPKLLGKKLSKTILADLDLSFFLQGHIDSLNIRVDARHKETGALLLQLISYVLPLVDEDRITSGYVRFFPDMPNEFLASFTGHWQDSVLTISDFRCEDWLVGSLEVQTTGSRNINGRLQITGAELSKLIEQVPREEPRYSGKLFANVTVSEKLDDPTVAGNFWILDGFFNGVGSFGLNGSVKLNRSGWTIDSIQVNKDHRPYLNAAVGYRRYDNELRIKLKTPSAIDSEEFLQALAGVKPDIFTGAASFDLSAQGPIADFTSPQGIPVWGDLSIQNGKIVWFHFDSLSANLYDERSFVSSRGLSFNQFEYIKKNSEIMKGYRLVGKAFLPFDIDAELDVSASGDGNLLAALPDISTFFTSAHSTGLIDLNIRGTYENPIFYNTHVKIENGKLAMSRVAPEATNIFGEAFIDSRGTFIDIIDLRGKLGNDTLMIRNVETAQSLLDAKPLLVVNDKYYNVDPLLFRTRPLRLGNSQMHLGALLIKSNAQGLALNIPGLMKPGEIGRFQITGRVDSLGPGINWGDKDEFIVMGPWSHPLFHGRIEMEEVNFQFPFDESSSTGDSLIYNILLKINWDVIVNSRKNNRYVLSMQKGLNEVYVNLSVDDEQSELHFNGILADSSFYTEGKVRSTRGSVEYLNTNFRVIEVDADFDKSDWWPIVSGSAQTVITDSTNFPYNVYLTLNTVDPITGETSPRGRFQNAHFKLSSDHPTLIGLTQEQILSLLGYSVEQWTSNATDVFGLSTDEHFLRPLIIRPVERQLERTLGLDVVRFSSRFGRNYLVSKFLPNLNESSSNIEDTALSYLRRSRLTVGKYLINNLYLLYIGQLEALYDYNLVGQTSGVAAGSEYDTRLQLRHRLGLEYRLNPSMLLHFEYDYNPLLATDKSDQRIWIRHSFPVDFPSNDH